MAKEPTVSTSLDPARRAELEHESLLSTGRELLKEKLQEGRAVTTLAVSTFSVYLAINFALLKFSFDASLGSSARPAMIVAGIITSLVYLIGCGSLWPIRRALLRDLTEINTTAGQSIVQSACSRQFLALWYVALCTTLWTGLATIGWSYLLWILTRV